jgi:hypothetical protein
MPTLVIENMSSTLYAQLQKAATSNRRSITQQTLTFLEQCLTRSFALNEPVAQPVLKQGNDKEWLKSVKPVNVGFPITEEWLSQAKSEGRE